MKLLTSIKKSGFWRSKHFSFGVVILTIGAGALFLFWPQLSGQLLFPQKCIGLYHYLYFSVMEYFVNDLHMLPNWYPGDNSGYPVSLTLDAFLNPIFLFTLKFIPSFTANNLMIFVFFLLNGLSFYAFVRALKLSKTASLIAAIAYSFSGVVVRNAPITTIVTLMPFLPLSFLCCLKIMHGKMRWLWLWLPLLLYSWISGWSEMIIYALVSVTFFALYLIVKNRKSEKFKYRYLILFFGAVVLSVLILSPWFLSVMHFVSLSPRADGIDIESAGSSTTTFSHLIHLFNPRISVFYGELLPIIQFGAIDYFLYIGTLPLLLVIASLFIKNKKQKNYLIFFMLLTVGSILMIVNNSPLFWLFHKIPVLNWFKGAWKWSFVVVFASSILAGYSFDNIKDFFKHRFSKRILLGLGIATIVVTLGIGCITVFDQKIKSTIASYGMSHYKNTPDRVFLRTDNYYHNLIEKMSQSLVDNFSFKNKWVIITFVLWLITLIHFTLGKYELIPHQKWRILAVAVTFMGSVFVWTGYYDGPPVSYLKTEPATAQYLHSVNPYKNNSLPLNAEKAKTLEPYRIFLYTPDRFISVLSEKYNVNLAGYKARSLFSREMMDDNVHIAFNFDTFFNHRSLNSQRQAHDMHLLIKQQKPHFKEAYTDTAPFDEFVTAFENLKNFQRLGMLNIKYILTPFQFDNGLEPVFTTHVIDGKLPIYIYENPYFMPRWYFADTIKWTKSDNQTAFENLKTIDDFKKTTLLESLSLNDLAITTTPDPKDSFEVQLYTAGKLKVKTKTTSHRFLVFSENRQPFWEVTVNSEPTLLYTANYLFQAVLVPPGENMIEFRYPNLLEQGIISAKSYIK